MGMIQQRAMNHSQSLGAMRTGSERERTAGPAMLEQKQTSLSLSLSPTRIPEWHQVWKEYACVHRAIVVLSATGVLNRKVAILIVATITYHAKTFLQIKILFIIEIAKSYNLFISMRLVNCLLLLLWLGLANLVTQ